MSRHKDLREYSYDSLGRISQLTTDAKADQALASAETDCRYTFDDLGRISRMSYYMGENEKERYEYSYDKNDQIISESIMNVRTADPINAQTEYTYDRLGQLVGSELTDSIDSSKDKEVTYTYDIDGNRTEKVEGDVTTSYTFDGLNRLAEETVTRDPGTANEEIISQIEYSFDGRGNQISEVASVTGQSTENVSDAAGRLKSLTSFEGGEEVLVQENHYDGEGKRIIREESKDIGNSQTEDTYVDYHYSNGQVGFTKDESGAELLHNLYSPQGSIIAAEDLSGNNQELYVYTKDIRNSTRCLLDEDLACAGMYTYGDFGETEELQDVVFDSQTCYTGGIYDESTGLYYLNARYYDPSKGRFISEDTYRGETDVPDTWHLYAYCANDPMNYVDPSGHKYSKYKAVKYARKWAKNHNTKYKWHIGADCTNYVSQCVEAGEKKQNRPPDVDDQDEVFETTDYWYSKKYTEHHGKVRKTYWHESTSWTVVDHFYEYWKSHGAKTYKKLSYKQMYKTIKKGDIVQLRSSGGANASCHHSVIISVANKSKSKYCSHSKNRKDKPISNLKPGTSSYRIVRPQ